MLPYFGEVYGNPHSRNHSFGWEAEQAVEMARENVAKIINANPKEVILLQGQQSPITWRLKVLPTSMVIRKIT